MDPFTIIGTHNLREEWESGNPSAFVKETRGMVRQRAVGNWQ